MIGFAVKLRQRAVQFVDLFRAIRQAGQYERANKTGQPIFYVDASLRRHSLLRTLDSKTIQLSRLFRVSDEKRSALHNLWVKSGFIAGASPVRYQGRGFFLEMPTEFQNTADVIVNDLREIYLENRYTALFPFGCLINDGDVVLDCGANIGAFAIYAASLGRNVRVLAFEPERATFETLCRNVESNGLSNQVQCFPYGVAASDGFFRLLKNEKCFTMHKLATPEQSVASDVTPATGEQIVRCVTIDQIMDEISGERCNVIKMDIEGAERSALRGAVKTIRHYRPRLTIAAYHLLNDPFVLSVIVKEILSDYNILVSPEGHLYAFI